MARRDFHRCIKPFMVFAASASIVVAAAGSAAAAPIHDHLTKSAFVRIPGVVTNVEVSDRYVSFYPVDGPPVLRVVDTKTGMRKDYASCSRGGSGRGVSGDYVLIPCPDRTSTLLNVATGVRDTIQPASSDPSVPGYVDIGKIWMLGSATCADGEGCAIYRRKDTGETKSFEGPFVERDLDDPELAPLRLCSPFNALLKRGLGSSAMWRGQIIAYSKKRLALGTCGTGKLRAISPAGHAVGSRSPSLAGGWTAWVRDDCSSRLTLMSFDLRRSARYLWRPRSLSIGKDCGRTPTVKTTRYAAVVTTWAYSKAPDSVVDSYYRVWLTKRP